MQMKYRTNVKFISFATLLSLVVGGFWTLVFYPGIYNYDGMAMWIQARQNSYATWHPPIMAMFMHITTWLPGSVPLFSWIQGTFFTFSILFILRKVIKHNWLLAIAALTLLAILPSLWMYPAMIYSNVWTSAFAMLSAVFLIKAIDTQNKRMVLLSTAILSLAIAFRHEAFFLLSVPLAVSQFFHRSFTHTPKESNTLDAALGKNQLAHGSKQLGTRLLSILLITFIGLAPARLIEKLPIVEVHNKPAIAAFINQYFGTIHFAQGNSMTPADVMAERRSFNQQFSPTTFDRSLELYRCGQPARLWSKQPAPFLPDTMEANQAFIFEKVKAVALKYPTAFLQHRICNLSVLLQIPFITTSLPPLAEDAKHPLTSEFEVLGLTPRSRFPALRQWMINGANFTAGHPLWHWLYRYYVFVGLAALLLFTGLYLRNWAIAIPAAFSVMGFAGYLIADGFAYTRYLLPTYIFSWISLFAFLDYILCTIGARQDVEASAQIIRD